MTNYCFIVKIKFNIYNYKNIAKINIKLDSNELHIQSHCNSVLINVEITQILILILIGLLLGNLTNQ